MEQQIVCTSCYLCWRIMLTRMNMLNLSCVCVYMSICLCACACACACECVLDSQQETILTAPWQETCFRFSCLPLRTQWWSCWFFPDRDLPSQPCCHWGPFWRGSHPHLQRYSPCYGWKSLYYVNPGNTSLVTYCYWFWLMWQASIVILPTNWFNCRCMYTFTVSPLHIWNP